jgi:nucleoside phosphorylase
VEYNDAGHIIMAGTAGGSDTTTNAFGLVQGHAYNVLDLLVLSNGQRLVKMQNPWSAELYFGDWSDASDL